MGWAKGIITAVTTGTKTIVKGTTSSAASMSSMFKGGSTLGKTAASGATVGKTVGRTAASGATAGATVGRTAAVGATAGKTVGRTAAVGATAGKTAGKTAVRNVDEAGKVAIKNADDAAVASAKQAGKQTDSVVRSKAALLSKVAAVGTIAVSALSLKNYYEKNGKLYNIISIDDVSNDNTNIKTQITILSGGDKFNINDTLEIKDTDCVPDITGSYSIFEIISNDKYVIITPSKITTKGTKGEVKLLTTIENVFADTLKSTLEAPVDITKSGIGAILEGLGISSEYMWIIIVVIVVVVIIILVK